MTDSGAKVLEKNTDHEDAENTPVVKHSKLRKANVALLADEDSRYAGKRVTRKSLEIPGVGSTPAFKHGKF